MKFPAALLLVLLAPQPALGAVHIIAVANDEGLVTDLPLRFAEADARAVVQTFSELHPELERRTELLTGATPGAVRELLGHLRDGLSTEDSLIFFLSSHGDRRGAHLGGEILSWAELDAALQALPARVAIIFIDACQSGALLGAKGFLRGPPAEISLEQRGPKGRVYLTSSGANEVSHESILFGGSPFAQHLISGLRGAADGDQDGAVTLSEMYRHIYARTYASTVESPLGAQRPQQKVTLTGAGDVVLAKAAGLKLSGAEGKLCYVLDAEEQRLLAELAGKKSINLRRGKYVVKCPLPGAEVAFAKLDLDADTSIDRLSFTTRAAELSLAKGSPPQRELSFLFGGLAAIDANAVVRGGAAIGLASLSDEVAFDLQANLQSDEGAILAGAGYILPWWRAGTLQIGIEAGAGFTKTGGAALFGQLTKLTLPIHGRTSLFLRFDALTEIAPSRDGPLTLKFLLSAGLALPIGAGSGIERSERMD